jgi:lipoprotein-anchoring transpeptidase ErfK/SrfK
MTKRSAPATALAPMLARSLARALGVVFGALAAGCAATPAPAPETVTVVQAAAPPALPEEVDWRAYFDDISEGAILVRLDARRLSYWSPGGAAYREFPAGIAEAPELEQLGLTRITRRAERPSWSPTPSMLARNPELPRFVGPGPENPMGEHALYLGWRYYAIHGTNDPASIGRATTSGCIRLFAEHIAWLYEHAEIGTPVLVVHERALASAETPPSAS